MPDKKDKPRSKVLQSWTEIKGRSKHIQLARNSREKDF